jgi:hypothetical protein
MTSVHRTLRERFEESVARMQKYYNKKRKTMESVKEGDLVMLNRRNIRAKQQCKKLEDKMLRPFKILSVGGNFCDCKLKFPDSWKIHSVFVIDLVERYWGTDPKKQAIEIEGDCKDWVMESIIARGPSDNNPKRHVLLFKWKVFEQEENTWETYEI